MAYVGLSLGTTLMFGLLATEPRYNDIIKPFLAMAPVMTTHNIHNEFPIWMKSLCLNQVARLLQLVPGVSMSQFESNKIFWQKKSWSDGTNRF